MIDKKYNDLFDLGEIKSINLVVKISNIFRYTLISINLDSGVSLMNFKFSHFIA